MPVEVQIVNLDNTDIASGIEYNVPGMIWGAVAIFVMVSIFGIVEFIGNALDVDRGGTFDPPTVQNL